MENLLVKFKRWWKTRQIQRLSRIVEDQRNQRQFYALWQACSDRVECTCGCDGIREPKYHYTTCAKFLSTDLAHMTEQQQKCKEWKAAAATVICSCDQAGLPPWRHRRSCRKKHTKTLKNNAL